MATHAKTHARAQAVMFDVDGTLILSNPALGDYRPLPGARETLIALRAAGTPYLLLTNGSAYPAPEQAEKLRRLELPVDDDQMLTPNNVAASIFRDRGLQRVMVLGVDGVRRALEAEGIQTVPPVAGQSADAVYVAWYPECGMEQIHAAALAVLDGVPFYTASDVPFFATSAGRTFGYSSAISGAIARVAGVEPALTGKPSAAALAFVARRLGVATHALAVVGDDPKVETEMARAGGAIGIGVTTGTTTLEQWAEQGPMRQAHHVVSRISDIFDIGLF